MTKKCCNRELSSGVLGTIEAREELRDILQEIIDDYGVEDGDSQYEVIESLAIKLGLQLEARVTVIVS